MESSREPFKTQGRCWKVPMEAAMPCQMGGKKRFRLRETAGESDESDNRRSKHGCIVESHESTRRRLERTLPKDPEDRIAGKGFHPWGITILCTSLFLFPKQRKIGCKSRCGQRVGAARKTASMANGQSKEQKRGHSRGTEHLKNAELEPKFQKYKGQVVLRGDIVKTIQALMQCFVERPRMLWMSLQGCQIAEDKQPTQYQLTPKSKWRTLKDQSQNAQIYGWVYHDTSGPNLGQTSKTQWFVLNDICMVTLLLDFSGKRHFEKVTLGQGWEKVPNWECLFVHVKQRLFSVYVDVIKMAGRKLNLSPMWKKLMKLVDLGEPTSFFDHVYLGCTQRECKSNESMTWRIQKDVRITNLRWSNWKVTCLVGKISRENSGLVFWHGRSCEEMRGKELWIGKKEEWATLQSLRTISSKKGRTGNGWRIVQILLSNRLKMLFLARIGRLDIL